eukprot:1859522-Rhodomonas_salina.2
MQAALMKRNSSKVFPATPELQRSASLELTRSNSGLANVPVSKTQKKVLSIIESKAVTTAIICATLFALCGADVWVLSGPSPKYDVALYSVSLIVFLALLLEFALLSRFKPRYAWSLFSFLDFLAVISLIPDVLMLFDVDPMSQSKYTPLDHLDLRADSTRRQQCYCSGSPRFDGNHSRPSNGPGYQAHASCTKNIDGRGGQFQDWWKVHARGDSEHPDPGHAVDDIDWSVGAFEHRAFS